jgi:plasmid replication initiation protein
MGRDELNLAEFPLAALAGRVGSGKKTLVFEDRIWDRGRGRQVTRRLTISGSDQYGLPTALDDEVIVGLVQLTKAADFASRCVNFSRYELIRILGWRDEGRSYRRVEESLKRWLGVTLYYDNAWWDKRQQRWVAEHFHILEHVVLLKPERGGRKDGQQELPLSSFTWNERVFQSFDAGYLKQLDMELYRRLRLAVSKRMYRFLDKRFQVHPTKAYLVSWMPRILRLRNSGSRNP